jgi:hypothetical protein
MQYLIESGFFSIGILFVFIFIAVLFLLAQHNTLKAIKPENRLITPGQVWIQLIPILGQIWQFFIVTRIADSIRKEITSRQDDSILGFSDAAAVEEINKRPTFLIGITYCILFTTGIILKFISLPRIQGWFSLSGMICWIIYWVQLAKWKRKLIRQHI